VHPRVWPEERILHGLTNRAEKKANFFLYRMSEANAKPAQRGLDEKEDVESHGSSSIISSWNSAQETLLKGISERANCMRWLHTQCNLHFESVNFYLTIPNVVISTLNGGFTMSLTSLFPEPGDQKVATTIIGLISIFSGVLITMNQYMKSQQMMEAHRSAGLAYGKLHRLITNELSLRRDQRQHALEFLKLVRTEQDRLENTSPSILPSIILKFNIQFENRNIEKPEIAGDLDEVEINQASRKHKHNLRLLQDEDSSGDGSSPVKQLVSVVKKVTEKRLPFPRTIPKSPTPRRLGAAPNPLPLQFLPSLPVKETDEHPSGVYSRPNTPPEEDRSPLNQTEPPRNIIINS
jgi:hypothetical protein